MPGTEDFIGAQAVAELLGTSIATLRDYRKRGLIVVAAKRGNTDLYDKADVIRRHATIREKRQQGFSLSQISGMLAKGPAAEIGLNGAREPAAEMSSQERLEGFLADLYINASPETKKYVDGLCKKWNIRYQHRQ